jgi:Tol biopolymer transport system component
VNNLFLKNTQTNDLTLVTPIFGNGDSVNAEITSDGKNLVFQSLAANFISNDTNGAYDIYIEDLQTKTLKLVSSDSSGIIGNRAVNPSVSADGLKVAFASEADNFLGSNNVTMNLNATPWLPTANVTANNINVSVLVDIANEL